jgi:hypothetical protein
MKFLGEAIQRRFGTGVPLRLLQAALALSVAHFLGACAPLPISQQRLLAKPGMQFSDVRAYNEASRATAQLEPGRVVTGGAQASVCTTCR